MTEQEQQEYDRQAEIDIVVANQRGNFIHLMITIESMIEDIIKHHYCKDSVKEEFMYSVLSKENFTFNTKYELMCFILKNNFKEFYEANDTHFKTLATLIEYRNHFAHRKFFSANPANYADSDAAFHFEHYKTKNSAPFINTIKITLEEYKTKLKQISAMVYKLLEVYQLIGINDSEILKYHKK